jgi:hypothetical protein
MLHFEQQVLRSELVQFTLSALPFALAPVFALQQDLEEVLQQLRFELFESCSTA